MAIDSYMMFQTYDGNWQDAESQVHVGKENDKLSSPQGLQEGKVFEIEDYSFDIEQTLSIGSQASGAGAGKVTFNPFSITRNIDKLSPKLFQMACSGTPFKMVSLFLRKSVGSTGTGGGSQDVSGQTYLRFDFKLVAVKTIEWAHDDEAGVKETVTFEYGGMVIRYCQQNPDGSFGPAIPGGWNRVKNVSDQDPSVPLGKVA
jgi:type VI protein secretion system component Hcp